MMVHTSDTCIFCKIIRGEIPTYKMYEDDRVLALLDHRPVQPGATLVIPKEHYEHFIDLPDDLAQHIITVGNKIGRKIKKELNPLRVGFVVAGFGVDHVHYHVIPMHRPHDITSQAYAYAQDGEVIFDAEHVAIATPEERERVKNLIKI